MPWQTATETGTVLPASIDSLKITFAITSAILFLIERPLALKTPTELKSETPSLVNYPVGAVDFIKERRLIGNLLTEFEWGEYAIWALYPACRVAIDVRYETVYPPEVLQEYFDFLSGRPGGRHFLQRFPPEMVLLRSQRYLNKVLSQTGQWRVIYQDRQCVLFAEETYYKKHERKISATESVNEYPGAIQ